MSRWWRAHASALDDPKVQRLPGETFKAWFNLLCIACLRDGVLPPLSDIAFALRRSEAATTKLLEDLQGAGLIDQTEAGLMPHNWNGRQYKSDVSNERVKRYRERQRNGEVTADVTLQKRPQRTETDTETESEEEIIRAFALFNDATKRTNWPAAQKLDDRRKRRLKDRLSEVGGVDGFAMALAKALHPDIEWRLS